MALARPGAARYDAGAMLVIARELHRHQERDVIVHGTYQSPLAPQALCTRVGVQP